MNPASTSVEFESKPFNNKALEALVTAEDDQALLVLFFVMLYFLLLRLKFVYE